MNTKAFTLLFFTFTFLFIGCKKDDTKKLNVEFGSMTDIDGNVYSTVKIGDQWWMAENLKVKRYRNGDSVKFVQEINYNLDSTTWNHLDSGAYCIIDNTSESSQNYKGKMFGYLYNGYTLTDTRNIAPLGWHIPTDNEWMVLEEFLGMSTTDANSINWRGNNEGNMLKYYTGWKRPSDIYSVWGSNESGFTALGGSCCMFNGTWGNPGTFSTGFWWTSSTEGDHFYYRYLDFNKSNVFRYYGPRTYGFSIRCIKD